MDASIPPLRLRCLRLVGPLVPALSLFWLLLWLLVQGPLPVAADSQIVHVKSQATGNGSGDSWANATTLTNAISIATTGNEIWVATGVYTPGTTVSSTFVLTDDVAIYGGFAATETLRSQRDWQANPTVLSGDLDGDDTFKDVNGVVTDTEGIQGFNAYHVVSSSGVTRSAILDGFYLTAGKGGAAAGICGPACGAGIQNLSGSPTLANLMIQGNVAEGGGGMANLEGSHPSLTLVTFTGNRAAVGGGMLNQNGSQALLTQVTFTGNHANAGGGIFNVSSNPILNQVTIVGNSADDNGGGIYNGYNESVPPNEYVGSHPTLTNVTLENNSADEFGGGIYNRFSSPTLTSVTFRQNFANDGAGMANVEGSHPSLTNVLFADNTTGDGNASGGGIYNHSSSPSLTDVTFHTNFAPDGGGLYNESNSNPTLTNVAFFANSALNGAGMANRASSPTLTNVTLSGNLGIVGGGIHNQEGSTPLIQNSILWDNDATSSPNLFNSVSTPTIQSSLIQGLNVSGAGNLDGTNAGNAPQFVEPVNCGVNGCMDNPETPAVDESADNDNGNLRLGAASPAIDAGNNSADLDGSGPGNATIAGVASDVAAQPRTVAVRTITATVDLGAYEAANLAPTITSSPPPTATVGITYTYNISTADANHPSGSGLSLSALGLPVWLAYTATGNGTGMLSGTPAQADVGNAGVTLQLQDGAGLTTTQTFTILVGAGNPEPVNNAPLFTSTPLTSVAQDSVYTYAITTTDPDEDDTHSLSLLTAATWLDLTDNGDGTGILSGSPGNAEVGEHAVTLRVQDSGGLTATQSFVLTVLNTNDAPTFTSTPVTTATVGQAYVYAVTTSDPDVGDTRTLARISPSTWLTLTSTGNGLGTLSGTPTVGDVGAHVIVLEVEDAAGLTAQQSFTVTVAAAPTGSLSGQVMVNGVGLAGVTVTVSTSGTTHFVGSVAATAEVAAMAEVVAQDVTDSEGRYRFDGLPPGPYTLTFTPPPGYATPAPQDVVVVAGQTTPAADVTVTPEATPTGEEIYLPSISD